MPHNAASIFVSYSSLDSPLVGPVVQLLRASRVVVYRDADSIRPGRMWRKELEKAVREARLIVVFCCAHSYASFEVVYEYRLAMELGKDVLPLRLDATPVPADLRAYQLIDFRSVVGAGHSDLAVYRERESVTETPGASSDRGLGPAIAAAWYRLFRRRDVVIASQEIGPVTCASPTVPAPAQAEQKMAQLIVSAVAQRTGIDSRLPTRSEPRHSSPNN